MSHGNEKDVGKKTDMLKKSSYSNVILHDVHCHIMYGVDDGAKDKEQSARMLEIAYKEGIRNIILTPHYRHPYEEEEKEIVEKRFRKLKTYVDPYQDNGKFGDTHIQFSNTWMGDDTFYSDDYSKNRQVENL